MKGNIPSIKTQKTGNPVAVSFPEHLMNLLQFTETGKETFIIRARENSFGRSHFSVWFVQCSTEAGIKKSAHGIRKLSATLAAEAGATAHELMAGYG